MNETPQFANKSRKIGDHTYKVVLFPAGPGFELLIELKNVFGDAVGSAFGQNIEAIIQKIGGQYSKTEVRELVQRLLEWTFVEGHTQSVSQKEVFDKHFAGNYGELFKVLAFVVEVNYATFFGELKSAIAGAVGRLSGVLQTVGATNLPDLSKFQNSSGNAG